MSRHPALRAWPRDKRDALRIALWTSEEIVAATGGTASGAFQCAGVEIDCHPRGHVAAADNAGDGTRCVGEDSRVGRDLP